jgi:hypothetical protein
MLKKIYDAKPFGTQRKRAEKIKFSSYGFKVLANSEKAAMRLY